MPTALCKSCATTAIEAYSGDNDANDLCACPKYDSILESIYEGKGYKTPGIIRAQSVLNRAQADELVLLFKSRILALNKTRKPDCEECIYPWDKLVTWAVERSVAKSINGNCR